VKARLQAEVAEETAAARSSYNDNSASNDKQKATLFNNYFYSVFTPISYDQPPPNKSMDTKTNQHLISINIFEEDNLMHLFLWILIRQLISMVLDQNS